MQPDPVSLGRALRGPVFYCCLPTPGRVETDARYHSRDLMTSNDQPAIASGQTSANQRAFAIALLLVGAVCAGMGQTIVFSVLPPLAREIGMSEMQVGLIFMTSAMCWVFFGPRWGRLSDSAGRKRFIVIGLIGFVASMALFGGVIKLGLAGILSGAPLYVALLMTRSLYGVFGSASPPAAQAYIADRTSAVDRTAGIASFSAAFGFGAMLGPGFGAAAAVIGPVAPFFAIAGLAAVMGIAVFLRLPERTKPTRRDNRAKLKVTDKRLAPLLVFSIVFGVLHAIPIQTIAFYMIDRLNLTPEEAPQLVGIGLMCAAMASLVSQLVIVQRLRLAPRLLMRIAPVLIVLGHALIWTNSHLGPIIFGMLIAGFGAGLAIPGVTAAASLAVASDEQGAAIGLTNAAGASGFILSPLIGFNLYDIAPQAPFIFTMVLAGALWFFAMTNRAISKAQPGTIADAPAEAVNEPASTPYQ